jgi:adenylate cyclase
VSGEVVAEVGDQFVWRLVDRVVAAGTTEVHDIYEPLGELLEASRHAEFLACWQQAQTAYAKGDFAAALASFRDAESLRPGDGPCAVLTGRCESFLGGGAPSGWNGAWHFERK